MTIKKMLLLVSAVAALVAFAAPAAAQAADWHTDPGGKKLGSEEEKQTFDGTGELSSTVTGVVTGPAVVHVHGNLWNGAHGEGEVTEFKITVPEGGIPTNLPGCSATAATNSTEGEGGAIWPITMTKKEAIHIEEVTFTNHYNHQCQTFGLPATAPAHGTATGSYTNATGCMDFVNAGSLTTEDGLDDVALNGEVCLTDPGVAGGKYTAL
jgi:hypothetical protein